MQGKGEDYCAILEPLRSDFGFGFSQARIGERDPWLFVDLGSRSGASNMSSVLTFQVGNKLQRAWCVMTQLKDAQVSSSNFGRYIRTNLHTHTIVSPYWDMNDFTVRPARSLAIQVSDPTIVCLCSADILTLLEREVAFIPEKETYEIFTKDLKARLTPLPSLEGWAVQWLDDNYIWNSSEAMLHKIKHPRAYGYGRRLALQRYKDNQKGSGSVAKASRPTSKRTVKSSLEDSDKSSASAPDQNIEIRTNLNAGVMS